MKLIRDLNNLPDNLRRGAIAIGNFDGVHLGHERIILQLVAKATELGGPAIVFTFDPHPARILRPGQVPPPLTWTARKAELLAALGVEAVIAYPTDKTFLRLEARQFFDQIVRDRLDARAMVEGTNFFFGHDRTGNVEVLGRFCQSADIALEVVQPVEIDGRIVSSSLIRKLVADGQVDQAAGMLTQPYRIRGTVVRGAGRGMKLGFPTANLDGVDTLLPGEGIYAGRTEVERSLWPAAISIGPNPTFGEGGLKVETYLVGYEGCLYERVIEVDFLARLRDIVRFDSAEQLVAQMHHDVAAARRIATH